MSIGDERTETLKLMCETFKFIEELAGNTTQMQQQKLGKGYEETRSDDIDAAEVIGAVRLIYKTYLKKQEKEKQTRTNRIAAGF